MPIFIDPQTRQRIIRSKHSGDINWDRVGDPAVQDEDVPLIGDWEDWTGSGVVSSRSLQMFAGLANEFFGTDASIENRTDRGNESVVGTNAETHRRRRIKMNKDFIDGKRS